ncbi:MULTISPECIES: energy transducer TonB [unclassified Massilia]|uniref:energy transducer TonB family protein n=1 Tax=unclassified Massilia TaxID=2609279 RepID=UPI00178143B7|nr:MULTISPECIES: energy transducer TonB [unclassified Massilia]MBD8530841.1 energy transducer TonB [Massilia sp. CFBP 13647]MBD8674541.1 energy transducer TonB [Massilia sp. CFBP 13721]
MIALAASVAAHAVLLAIRFVAPDALRFEPADPGLEVILVNAKHAKAPVKAEALAQANLEGGGMAEAGRSKSPLPDLRKNENGDSIKALQKRIVELEQLQQNVLSRVQKSSFKTAPVTDNDKPDPTRTGADEVDTTRQIARMTAEITQTIEDQNKRPKRTHISPSTRQVGYALYYKAMQKQVEEVGTLNFPQQNGKKLYGELVISIPVFQDGSLYQKEGGPRVERSSGNPALDKAALEIVRRAAPFGAFPQNMRTAGKDDLWIVITRFTFTREEKVKAELQEQA